MKDTLALLENASLLECNPPVGKEHTLVTQGRKRENTLPQKSAATMRRESNLRYIPVRAADKEKKSPLLSVKNLNRH